MASSNDPKIRPVKKSVRRASLSLACLFLLLFLYSCRKHTDAIVPAPALEFPLTVVATSPAANDTNGFYDRGLSAVVNNLFDTTKYVVSFSVWEAEIPVAGTVRIEDSLICFLPQTDLLPLRSYEALVTLAHKGDTAAAYRYRWRFTTKAPDEYKMTQRSTQVTGFVRDGNRCLQMGDYFYSFGGWTDNGGEQTYNDVYRSSGDLRTWAKMPDASWPGRHVFGCVKKDGKAWVLGGDNLYPTFDVWNSEDGLRWTKVGAANPPNVGARTYFGCATHRIKEQEWIYVVGGHYKKDVVRSLDGIEWETVATDLSFLGGTALPQGEGWTGSLVSFDGALYVICGGGTISEGPPRKTVWKSTDNGVTWERQADFPGSPRRYTDVVVFDEKIWVVGGYDDTGVGNLADVWYMTKSGAWHQVATPADYIGRHATGVGVYNNQLVIVCGNYHNDCWVMEKIK